MEKHKDNISISTEDYQAAVHACNLADRIGTSDGCEGNTEDFGTYCCVHGSLSFYTEVSATEPHTNNHKNTSKGLMHISAHFHNQFTATHEMINVMV